MPCTSLPINSDGTTLIKDDDDSCKHQGTLYYVTGIVTHIYKVCISINLYRNSIKLDNMALCLYMKKMRLRDLK